MLHHVTGSRVARSAPATGVLVVMLATLSVLLPNASAEVREAETRVAAGVPNVLIIVTDDQRSDLMKFLPRTRKWFGDKGVKFTRAFATTPLCCPFRASLMTGQFAHNSGVRRQEDSPRMVQEHTMQRYLHDAGYTTALLGKYLNSWPREAAPPYFDRFAVGKLYTDQLFNVDGRMKEIKRYVPNYLKSRAVKLLHRFETNDEKPWFMMLTPSNPHLPSTPAPRHKGVRIRSWQANPATRERNLSDKPPMLYRGRIPDRAKPRRGLYEKMARSLSAVDDLVGEVQQTMLTLGENSNTLAFFLSDNGFLLGEHALHAKLKPHPMVSRVPLYMRWTGGPVAQGIVDDRLVANIDILPTVLDAAGLNPTTGHVMDGHSLRGAQARSRMFLEGFYITSKPYWTSLITEDEQYTQYYNNNGAIAFREYYDASTDPWQLTNTLGDDDPGNDPSPLTLQLLSNQLEADRECAGATCP